MPPQSQVKKDITYKALLTSFSMGVETQMQNAVFVNAKDLNASDANASVVGALRFRTLRLTSAICFLLLFQLFPDLAGCNSFACNWKLPAYNGASLLTIVSGSFLAYSWRLLGALLLTIEVSLLTIEAFLLTMADEALLTNPSTGCKKKNQL